MTSVAGLKKRKAAGAIPPLLFAGRTVVTDMDASGAGVLEERLPSGEAIEVIVPGAIPGDVIELSWRAPLPGGRRGLAESFRLLEASPEAARVPFPGRSGPRGAFARPGVADDAAGADSGGRKRRGAAAGEVARAYK